MFRKLTANEIDCRVATVKDNGLSLLLYKDARCDMNILDETVGAFNWKREHCRDNANCIVSIWDKDKGQWISKEDTGTESFTEKEKGLASDSFKRACFNWGIGRELYTGPKLIWVKSAGYSSYTNKGGKPATYDRFKVKTIGYDKEGNINQLSIINTNTSKVVFDMGKQVVIETVTEQAPKATKKQLEVVVATARRKGISEEDLLSYCMKKYGVDFANIDQLQYTELLTYIQSKPNKE